jgi:hypothetical protein
MPGFIPGHEGENLCYHWIGFLHHQMWMIDNYTGKQGITLCMKLE